MHHTPTLPFGSPGCLLIPGRTLDDKGFIDFGTRLKGIDPLLQLSVSGAEEISRFIGWVPPANVTKLEQTVEDLQFRLEQSEAEKTEMHRELDAIDGLTKKAFVLRKAPGRPPKQKVA